MKLVRYDRLKVGDEYRTQKGAGHQAYVVGETRDHPRGSSMTCGKERPDSLVWVSDEWTEGEGALNESNGNSWPQCEVGVTLREAMSALADGFRIQKVVKPDGVLAQYEFRGSALWARCPRLQPGEWREIESGAWFEVRDDRCKWSIIPRETVHAGLTIQQCAERYPDAKWRRPGWGPWDAPEVAIGMCGLDDVAATDWEAKVSDE